MSLPEQAVAYGHADKPLTGVLYGRAAERERPGILVLHGGAGLDDHAREQARRWAAEGYAVLAADLYGDGVAGDRQRVMTALTALRDDPELLAGRARAGLDALRDNGNTTGPLAAIGYCFGGLAALTLARAGSGLGAAISIHGSLTTTAPAGPGAVTARVLVCHGSADPHITLDDVATFAAEMDHARADWRLIMYGGAMHGFTHRHARAGSTPGVAYQEAADHSSFAAAKDFLAVAS